MDAAIRAKRYRIRKANMISTDSEFGVTDGAPALKLSRSQSTNVLMIDEEPQIINDQPPQKEHLTIRTTRHGFTSFDDSLTNSRMMNRENSINLIVTPTIELTNLKISPGFSSSSYSPVKVESASPEIIELVVDLKLV
jgi:hypothetical protein